MTRTPLLAIWLICAASLSLFACSSYDDSSTDGDQAPEDGDADAPADGDESTGDGDASGDDPADGDTSTEEDAPLDGDTSTEEDTPSDGDAPAEEEEVRDPYPSGPYGYTYGDTIADFTLEDCDGNSISLSDYFDTGVKAIMINSAAGWCSVCRREVPTLQEWYEELKDEGFMILQPMFENDSGAPSNASFCASWRDEYNLTFPVLVDADNYFIDFHPSIQAGETSFATPLNLIIDRHMRIQYVLEGDIPHTIHDRILSVMESD